MPATRHDQGPNAALQVGYGTWRTSHHARSLDLVSHHFFAQTKPRSFLATGAYIVRRETPLALYKGLGAVLSGIVPKMAIRFASFEAYKGWLADKETGKTGVAEVFLGTCVLYAS